jgi:hypothetical protein
MTFEEAMAYLAGCRRVVKIDETFYGADEAMTVFYDANGNELGYGYDSWFGGTPTYDVTINTDDEDFFFHGNDARRLLKRGTKVLTWHEPEPHWCIRTSIFQRTNLNREDFLRKVYREFVADWEHDARWVRTWRQTVEDQDQADLEDSPAINSPC